MSRKKITLTERAYVAVGNLEKVRAAEALLRDILPSNEVPEVELSQAQDLLRGWRDRLHNAIETR